MGQGRATESVGNGRAAGGGLPFGDRLPLGLFMGAGLLLAVMLVLAVAGLLFPVGNLQRLWTVPFVIGLLALAAAFLLHGYRRSALALGMAFAIALLIPAALSLLPGHSAPSWVWLSVAGVLIVLLVVARRRLW